MKIDSNYFLNIVLALAVGTIFIRGSIIFLSSKIEISNRAKQILSFIPAAILPALIAPLVFFHQGKVPLLLGKERLVVLTLSAVVCYLTRNTLLTILFGLISLYLVTFYFII